MSFDLGYDTECDSDGGTCDTRATGSPPRSLVMSSVENSPKKDAGLETFFNGKQYSERFVDDDDFVPHLFERQVRARKVMASETISKLVCDEVDRVEDVSSKEHSSDPFSADHFGGDPFARSMSRGRSNTGARGRNIGRSKSQFASNRVRSRSMGRSRSIIRGPISRGLEEPSFLDELEREEQGRLGFSRTKGTEGPTIHPRNEANSRKARLEELNASLNSEPEVANPERKHIRFA